MASLFGGWFGTNNSSEQKENSVENVENSVENVENQENLNSALEKAREYWLTIVKTKQHAITPTQLRAGKTELARNFWLKMDRTPLWQAEDSELQTVTTKLRKTVSRVFPFFFLTSEKLFDQRFNLRKVTTKVSNDVPVIIFTPRIRDLERTSVMLSSVSIREYPVYQQKIKFTSTDLQHTKNNLKTSRVVTPARNLPPWIKASNCKEEQNQRPSQFLAITREQVVTTLQNLRKTKTRERKDYPKTDTAKRPVFSVLSNLISQQSPTKFLGSLSATNKRLARLEEGQQELQTRLKNTENTEIKFLIRELNALHVQVMGLSKIVEELERPSFPVYSSFDNIFADNSQESGNKRRRDNNYGSFSFFDNENFFGSWSPKSQPDEDLAGSGSDSDWSALSELTGDFPPTTELRNIYQNLGGLEV